MSPRALVPLLLLSLSVTACGGASPAVRSAALPPEDQLLDPAEGAMEESVDVPLTQLERADVVATVDAGLGAFLQEVEVRASMVDGAFQGFEIVRFDKPDRWRGVGLLPGDVIVRINDQPIERPEQAYAAFAALKSAPALEVSYLRQDRAMRLSLPIVGEAPSAPAPASAPASASATPSSPAPKAPASDAKSTAPAAPPR